MNSVTQTITRVLFLSTGIASAQSILYVSPGGTGTQCSSTIPCALLTARGQARTLLPGATTNVTVRLYGGLYALDSTFTLDARDGGRPGIRMVYEAEPGAQPVLSGGKFITGWTLFDAGKNIWRASVPTGMRTRQLYVNDLRAIRARGPDNPAGWTKTANGYTAPDGAVAAYANLQQVEVVFLREWKSYRCPVGSASGTTITMATPCWTNAQAHTGWTMDGVSWLENAYELLDAEGEWYLNETQNALYYKPRAGENMASARVVAPVLEVLLNAQGTLATSLRYLTLRGLTFAHATWMKPSSNRGFPDMQATYQWGTEGKAISNVQFWYVDSLVLERNVFRALGGNGPALEAGSRNSRISCNALFDISGNGMHIGNINANPADARDQNLGITVENNYITQAGQEYHGCAGIFLGYVAQTRVLANEIHGLPHMGISLGWGWGTGGYMRNNEVAYNLIYDHMNRMFDGGGVYTLSPQQGTHVHHNFIHDQIHELGALYPDEGSSFMRWDSNVVQNVVRWLHMWTGSIQNDTVINNYYNNNVATLAGTNCIVTPNTLVTGTTWPAPALRIMAAAGIPTGCQDVKTWVNLSLPTEISSKGHQNRSGTAMPRLHVDLNKGQVYWGGSRNYHDLAGRKALFQRN